MAVSRIKWLGAFGLVTLVACATPDAPQLSVDDIQVATGELGPTGSGWASVLGTGAADSGSRVAVDPAGNAWVLGNLGGPATIAGQAFPAGAFVARYASNGTVLAAKTLAGLYEKPTTWNLNIATDASGNLYLTGTLSSGAKLSWGTTTLTSTTTNSLFVAKMSATGVPVWAKLLVGTGSNAQIVYNGALALDASGNVIVGGQFYGTGFDAGGGVRPNLFSDGSDLFYAKLATADGAHLWSVVYGSKSWTESVDALTVDGAGNVLGVGSSPRCAIGDTGCGPLAFGTYVLTDFVLYIVKLNGATGAVTWAAGAGPDPWPWDGSVMNLSIAAGPAGDVVLSGRLAGQFNFGSVGLFSSQTNPVNLTPSGDAFVAKFSGTNGTPIWAKVFGSPGEERATFVQVDGANNIWVGGIFGSYQDASATSLNGTINFGGSAFNTAAANAGFLAKLTSANGAHLWSRKYDGLVGMAFAGGFVDRTTGQVSLVGTASDVVNFGFASVTSAGDADLVVARFLPGTCGNNVIETGEACESGDCCSVSCQAASPDTLCRVSNGGCQFPAFCSGTGTTCPAAQIMPANTICSMPSSACDSPLVCDGTSAKCPYDRFVADDSCTSWAEAYAAEPITGTVNAFQIEDLDALPSGAYAITGDLQVRLEFPGGALNPSAPSSAYIAAFDPIGRLTWAKNFGDKGGRGLAHSPDGQSFYLAQTGYNVVTLKKVSALDGTLQWTTPDINGGLYWADSSNGVVHPVSVDAAGNVLFAGYLMGPANFGGGIVLPDSSDPFIAKYTSAGVIQWAQRIVGSATPLASTRTAMDANGYVWVLAAFSGSINLGSGALTSAGRGDLVLARYTPAGVLQWAKRFGGIGDEIPRSIVVDAQGNATLLAAVGRGGAAVAATAVDFGQGGGVLSAGSALARFTPAGALTWSVQEARVSVPSGSAVQVEHNGATLDVAGNLIVTGSRYDKIETNGTVKIVGFIEKRGASTGVLAWKRQSADGGAMPWYGPVDTDSTGNVIVGGIYSGTFRPGVGIGSELLSARYFGSAVVDNVPFVMRLAETTLLPSCGDNQIDANEECDGGTCCTSACKLVAQNTVCRASTGTCDAPEFCTGTSGVCPFDVMSAAGTVCRAATGACDATEVCSGLSGVCPANAAAPAGYVCRPQIGLCDTAETCNGTATSCPADGFKASSVTCRAAASTCDSAELCSGSGTTCPADSYKAAGAVCRTSTGTYDDAESCTGSTVYCPADDMAGDSDNDNDGLTNAQETAAGTNPNLYDSDMDGVSDATEVRYGSNPLSAAAKPNVTEVVDVSFAGQIVGQRRSNGEVNFFHVNHLGSTQVVTDAAGTLIERVRYKPFGETLSDTNVSKSTTKFTGQEFDDEIGLYNYRARLYDPELGRFVGPDSIVPSAAPQALNRYAYANNSPAIFTDPSGHTGQNAVGTTEFGFGFIDGFGIAGGADPIGPDLVAPTVEVTARYEPWNDWDAFPTDFGGSNIQYSRPKGDPMGEMHATTLLESAVSLGMQYLDRPRVSYAMDAISLLGPAAYSSIAKLSAFGIGKLAVQGKGVGFIDDVTRVTGRSSFPLSQKGSTTVMAHGAKGDASLYINAEAPYAKMAIEKIDVDADTGIILVQCYGGSATALAERFGVDVLANEGAVYSTGAWSAPWFIAAPEGIIRLATPLAGAVISIIFHGAQALGAAPSVSTEPAITP